MCFAIQVYDRREAEFAVCWIDENKRRRDWCGTLDRQFVKTCTGFYGEWWKKTGERINDSFKKSRVDSVSIRTEEIM